MWTLSETTTVHPSGPAMTEIEAAAEAWGIGDSFAGDAFSDDGNPLSPSDGPCPTHFDGATSSVPAAWVARDRSMKHRIAMLLPVAISALLPGCGPVGTPRHGPPPPAMGLVVTAAPTEGPGAASADVASRYHHRDLFQGPND